MKTTS